MTNPFEFLMSLQLAMVRVAVLVAVMPTFKSSAGKAFLLPFPLAVALCIREASDTAGLSSMLLFSLGMKEAMLGAALGFMISRVFIVVSAAGAVLDQQAGYTVGALFNPSLGHSAGPIETLYTLLLVLILMTAGGGFYFPKAIMATYAVWPVTSLWPPAGSLGGFINNILGSGADMLVGMGMHIAMPILAMLMFSDLCVAMLSKYAAEISPMSISMAVKALLVCTVLIATLNNQTDNMRRLIALLLRVQ